MNQYVENNREITEISKYKLRIKELEEENSKLKKQCKYLSSLIDNEDIRIKQFFDNPDKEDKETLIPPFKVTPNILGDDRIFTVKEIREINSDKMYLIYDEKTNTEILDYAVYYIIINEDEEN